MIGYRWPWKAAIFDSGKTIGYIFHNRSFRRIACPIKVSQTFLEFSTVKQSGATSNKNLFLNRSFRSNRRRANLRGLVSIFPPFLLPLTQETSPRFHERYDFRETSKKIARCDSRVNVPRRNHGCDRTSEPLRGNLVIYLRPGPNSQTKCIQRSATKSGIDFHRISLLFFHSLSPLPPPVSVQRVFRHPFSRPSPRIDSIPLRSFSDVDTKADVCYEQYTNIQQQRTNKGTKGVIC